LSPPSSFFLWRPDGVVFRHLTISARSCGLLAIHDITAGRDQRGRLLAALGPKMPRRTAQEQKITNTANTANTANAAFAFPATLVRKPIVHERNTICMNENRRLGNPTARAAFGVRRHSEASHRGGISAAGDVREPQPLPEPKRCRASLAPLLTRIFKSPEAAWRSSARSAIFIATQPYERILKLRRSGMRRAGEPRATGLQPRHAAPTELDSAGRPLRYKYVAPAGACTGPREDPYMEQSLATALQTLPRRCPLPPSRLATSVAGPRQDADPASPMDRNPKTPGKMGRRAEKSGKSRKSAENPGKKIKTVRPALAQASKRIAGAQGKLSLINPNKGETEKK